MRSNAADMMNSINESGDYNDDIAAALRKAVEDFKANGTW
jgi:F-type H+-transporting ATPase subunit alpha